MYTKSKLLLLISFVTFINSSFVFAKDESSTTDNNDFQWFSAISLIAEVNEQFQLGPAGDQISEFEDSYSINWELHLEWKGFFYEQPGISQQRIDGQFSGKAVGYRFYSSPHWDVEALVVEGLLELGFGVGSATESLQFVRKQDLRAGVRANGFYDNYFFQFIWTPHSFKDEIGGNQISASIRRDWQIKNLNLYATAGVVYLSDDILSFYFDVSPELSADILRVLDSDPENAIPDSTFAPFNANDGLIYSSQVGFEYPITEHWVLGGVASYQRFPSSIAGSPFSFSDSDRTAFSLSISYVF